MGKKEFLLTDSLLEQLACKEKPNPRSAFFKPMKIYLRKHVKDLAESLYGSLEQLEREKEKREEKRLRKFRRIFSWFEIFLIFKQIFLHKSKTETEEFFPKIPGIFWNLY